MVDVENRELVRLSTLEDGNRFAIQEIEHILLEHLIDGLYRCRRKIDDEIVIVPGNLLVKPLRTLYS